MKNHDDEQMPTELIYSEDDFELVVPEKRTKKPKKVVPYEDYVSLKEDYDDLSEAYDGLLGVCDSLNETIDSYKGMVDEYILSDHSSRTKRPHYMEEESDTEIDDLSFGSSKLDRAELVIDPGKGRYGIGFHFKRKR